MNNLGERQNSINEYCEQFHINVKSIIRSEKNYYWILTEQESLILISCKRIYVGCYSIVRFAIDDPTCQYCPERFINYIKDEGLKKRFRGNNILRKKSNYIKKHIKKNDVVFLNNGVSYTFKSWPRKTKKHLYVNECGYSCFFERVDVESTYKFVSRRVKLNILENNI